MYNKHTLRQKLKNVNYRFRILKLVYQKISTININRTYQKFFKLEIQDTINQRNYKHISKSQNDLYNKIFI